MAARFIIFALLAFSLTHLALSVDPPQNSPSPEPVADSLSFYAPPSPDTGSPLESPISSPPAPPPSDLASPPPASSPGNHESPVPAPSPTEASDVNHSKNAVAGEGTDDSSSSGGISARKKTWKPFVVTAAACFVGLGAFVHKKRQENIRRARRAKFAVGVIAIGVIATACCVGLGAFAYKKRQVHNTF